MKVILHIGAHRTGTKTFQSYLDRHEEELWARGIAHWAPPMTRSGLFSGIPQTGRLARHSAMKRARGRLKLRLQKTEFALGAYALVVSDEAILGAMERAVRNGLLYADAGERLARFYAAFEGRVDQVTLNVRSLDHYWTSALSCCAYLGHPTPDRAYLENVAAARRTWRDVISDIACAMPSARIVVQPFERFAGRPDALLASMTGFSVPEDTQNAWTNRRPTLAQLRARVAERGGDASALVGEDDRWAPFTAEERAALREAYADDIMWLAAGADGLATLTEDQDREEVEWLADPLTRGHQDEFEKRRMAPPR